MKHPLFFLILLSALLTSCRKEEGIGGDAEISGQVWTYALNGSLTDTIADYAAEDTYVYIVFGDHSGFDKRIKTDYNGKFRFSYLYPGDYTIYTYSFDMNEIDQSSPVIRKVHISERSEKIEMERIDILSLP